MSHDPKLANDTAGSGHFRCFDRFGLGWTGYRIFPLSKQQLHDQPNAMGLWWNGVGLLGPRGSRLFTADLKRPGAAWRPLRAGCGPPSRGARSATHVLGPPSAED